MCKYIETCSRRGAPNGCHNGDAASYHRCEKALKKAGEFPSEPRFNTVVFPALKNGAESVQFKPLYQGAGISFEILSTKDPQTLYELGYEISSVRNETDDTLAGYNITTPDGTGSIFRPIQDF